MTSSQYALYVLGDTRATMIRTNRHYFVRGCKSQNLTYSSDLSLRLEIVKSESLVIASQPYSGEYVLGPCTHRPSHQGNRLHLKPFLILK